MVFPVVMYGYESWIIKKAEHQRIDAFELWCWRRLLPDMYALSTIVIVTVFALLLISNLKSGKKLNTQGGKKRKGGAK